MNENLTRIGLWMLGNDSYFPTSMKHVDQAKPPFAVAGNIVLPWSKSPLSARALVEPA